MGSLIKSVILEDGQFYSHWLSNHSPSSMFRTVFSLVLLFAVAYQHVEALECFHCGVPNSGQCGIPGGQKNLTCTGSARFCEVKFSNSRPILKSCSNATSIPKEYKAVAGDPEKRCKTSKGNQINTVTVRRAVAMTTTKLSMEFHPFTLSGLAWQECFYLEDSSCNQRPSE